MTPELIEVIGKFIVVPVCGAAVFWKLLGLYEIEAHRPEDHYRRIARDAGRRVAAQWKSKQRETEDSCPDQ